MLSLSIQQPSPPEKFSGSESDGVLRVEVERPQGGHRPFPIFAVGFLTHLDAEKQVFSIGRNIDSAVATHIAIRDNLIDLPLCEDSAVKAEPVNVRRVLAENRLSVARPNR